MLWRVSVRFVVHGSTISFWLLPLQCSLSVLRRGLCWSMRRFVYFFETLMCYYCVVYVVWIIKCLILNFQQDQKQDLLFDTFWLMTFFESVSLVGSQEITNVLVSDDDSRFLLLPYAFPATLSVVGILYIRNASSTCQSASQHASAIGSYQKSFFAHVLRGEWWVILLTPELNF